MPASAERLQHRARLARRTPAPVDRPRLRSKSRLLSGPRARICVEDRAPPSRRTLVNASRPGASAACAVPGHAVPGQLRGGQQAEALVVGLEQLATCRTAARRSTPAGSRGRGRAAPGRGCDRPRRAGRTGPSRGARTPRARRRDRRAASAAAPGGGGAPGSGARWRRRRRGWVRRHRAEYAPASVTDRVRIRAGLRRLARSPRSTCGDRFPILRPSHGDHP